MRSAALVMACGLLAASCTARATATEASGEAVDAAVVSDDDQIQTPASEDERTPTVVVVSGPVRYADEHGVLVANVDWDHHLVHPDFDLDVRMSIELTFVPHVAGDASPEQMFDVYGELLLDTSSIVCLSHWASEACGVVSVTDAELVGTAQLSSSRLFVVLDWRRFGVAKTQARASMVIGRWPDGSDASFRTGEVEMFDASQAVESAGLVGREFEIEVSGNRPRAISGLSIFGVGQGTLVLVPANDRT